MMYRVLLAENGSDTLAPLTLHLENSGFSVSYAHNEPEALERVQTEDVSVVIVGVSSGEANRYDLVRSMRELSNLPIMILSDLTADEEKIQGLESGADLFLTSSVHPAEIAAYVSALCRRYYRLGDSGVSIHERLVNGELELDMDRYELKKRGKPVVLTSVEMKIMVWLMKNPGRVFSKAQLYQCINGDYFEGDEKTMMVHVCNIRNKLEDFPAKPKYIKTVRGMGYKLDTGSALS